MTREMLPLVASFSMIGFFVIEIVYSRLKRDAHYDIRDAATNCVIGLVGFVFSNGLWGALTAVIFLAAWVATPLRFDMDSPWSWVALAIVHDFLLYWSHRASHTIGIMWAAHTVHHSSARLNLSVGFRTSWIGGAFEWVFILPLALMGFDPLSIAMVQVMTMVWGYFTHAAYVPRLGPLEWVFNTPAHHAVHHSADPKDYKSNFGAILMIWDRLFGTFREKTGPLTWGMQEMPAKPYNPVHLELSPFVRLLRRRKRATAR